jgi:hypothetical protein
VVDLNDAGRRLAAYRAEPTPPVAEVRAQSARRAHRRRLLTASVASIAAVAIVAAVVTVGVVRGGSGRQQVSTGPGPTPTVSAPAASQLPEVAHPVGSKAADWGQLRLWLPPGWNAAVPASCWVSKQGVYFSAQPPAVDCHDHGADQPSLWVTALVGTIPAMFRSSTINGVTVWSSSAALVAGGSPAVYDVPSLGVQIFARGAASTGVVDTLGPSALHAVLVQRYPTAVTDGWKTVTFDGFSAEVPAAWPQHTIRVVNTGGGATTVSNLPGRCGQTIFADPSVYFGTEPILSCPMFTPTAALQGETAPGDGLWLQQDASAPPTAQQAQTDGQVATMFRLGPESLTAEYQAASGSNTINIYLKSQNRTLQATIGLGLNPAVAEQIISSLQTVKHG